MKSTLDRKLFRELRSSAGASSAIAIVIAAGVAVFVMALSTLNFLSHTRQTYYDRHRFADIFATANRVPNHIRDDIAKIPGVAIVATRVVADITITVPGLDEPASGRLVSLAWQSLDRDSKPAGLNAIHLTRGRLPSWDAADEIVASEAFFIANRLTLGSTIKGLLNGRLQEMRIVGVALSPEFVFQIRPGDFLPDDRRFGVFWTSRQHLEAAFDMKGAFNDLSVRIMRGTSHRAVISRIDQVLEPFGGIGAYDRTEQISARFLDDEIKQLRATGLVIPVIFLAVAAFLLNVVLARRIELQREAIATLKAFGYSGSGVAWHYLKYALLISGTGAVIGCVAGTWMAHELCEMYSHFFRFPSFDFQPNPPVMALAGMISIASGSIGGTMAVARVMKMEPAEALRPPSPAKCVHNWIDQLWTTLHLPPTVVMILRRLRRRPITTAISMVGIGLATAVLMVSNFALDAIDAMIDFQFTVAQRQDIQVTFEYATAASSIHELANIDGVLGIEPFRSVAVRLSNGHLNHRTGILGLGQQRNFYRLLNSDSSTVDLPLSGIVLSDKLAELLGVSMGDDLTIEVLEDRRQKVVVAVAGITTEFSGTNAYMDRDALHRLLKEDRRISGAFLRIDSLKSRAIYDFLQQTPRTAGVSIKAAALNSIRQTIKQNQVIMQSFNTIFAAIIALGVVYNMARITMAEQQRDLATLQVLGFTRMEVSLMFLGELMIVASLAIPLGWLVGVGLCYSTVKGFESELYRIPLIITRENLFISAAITLVAAVTSGLIVRRSLDQVNLVEVLKSHG